MSRIADTFAALRAQGRTGLVTYVTAGDPDLPRSAGILRALDRGGADIIEVGVPFSDPLADGPVIQRATERALRAGTTLTSVLDLVAGERQNLRAPMVLFTYANPLLRMGLGEFSSRAAAAGVDGVLVLDLPLEEAAPLRASLDGAGLDTIFLLSPTTTAERMALAGELGRGFLYVISRLGVTGARDQLAEGLEALTGRIRARASLPIALGFGLSRPEHVTAVGRVAEAAVVGSALVERIAAAGSAPDLEQRVERFVGWLKGRVPAAEDA
jgi:tryptophan synthase alpha chain